MLCVPYGQLGKHKNLKKIPVMEVMSISVFGSPPLSPPPLTYQKRIRKAETFLRKLSESRDQEGPHENGLAKFAQTAPSSAPNNEDRAGKR